MDKMTLGTVLSVKKQWWLKINTKAVRMGALDGAVFPHIVKVTYTVDGAEYTKRMWLGAGRFPPNVGDKVNVIYNEEKPRKASLL